MLRFSLESINSRSPYRVQVSADGSFCFTTDESLTYEVGFVKDYMFSAENAYQIFLMPKGTPNTTKDDKMQQTVTVIIEEFFQSNDMLLDYICETRDGRQAVRNRLFSRWFYQYPKRDLFTLRTIEIAHEDLLYFASAIIRNDNPHYNEYMEAIDKFEAEMAEKLKTGLTIDSE